MLSQVAGPDIAAQLIHDDDAQQLGCAVEALVAEEQGPHDEEETLRPARRQRTGEPDSAARSVPPSADEDLIDYITTGAHARPGSDSPCPPSSQLTTA